MALQPEGVTKTTIARLFMRELDARGIACEGALAAASLTREHVSDVRRDMAWAQCMRFIDAALQLAPDDLGLCAGAGAELSDLDLAGLYIRSAPTGRDAFRVHHENREVFDLSCVTNVYRTRTALVISMIDHAATPARAALAECIFASSMKLMPEISGPIEPLLVCFRHRPANEDAHRRMFRAVRFGSHIDALFVPSEVFDRPLPNRDDTIRAVLEPYVARQLEKAQALVAADLPTRVRHGIRSELAEGRSSVDALAKRLRISPRSLRRALGALDTSYSDLLAQARRELATQLVLEWPRQTGPEVARRLGYADAHAFYRAFKRWTGLSLSEYRSRSGHDASADRSGEQDEQLAQLDARAMHVARDAAEQALHTQREQQRERGAGRERGAELDG